MGAGRNTPSRSISGRRSQPPSLDFPRRFRLLVRLLTQMERVLAINGLETWSVDLVGNGARKPGHRAILMRGWPDLLCAK